jgi:hypothetical protein
MKTELRSLRLSRYHLKIVDELQKEKGYTFTDAIKHIINEFSKIDNDKNSIKKFLQKLEKNLGNLNPPATSEPVVKSHELFDGLNEIGNNIRLILKALLIIGSADSRTLIDIENLLKEDE